MMAVPDPLDYGIHPKYGFIPGIPARELPPYYDPWMTLAAKAEQYVHNKTIRDKIRELPVLDISHLGDDARLLRLAHGILIGLSQCYIFVNGDDVPEVLPRQIAIPFKAVSDKLNYPSFPILHTQNLCRWKLKDQDGPLVPKNIEAIMTMNGGEKESYFMTSGINYEFSAAEGIFAVTEAQKAVLASDSKMLATQLEKLHQSLQNMRKNLDVVRDGCDPEHFFHKVMPFLNGWDSEPFHNKNLKGIVFEGVSDEQIGCIPTTVAQTATMPVFDAALGIKHKPEEEKRRLLQRNSMPPEHVRFIVAVENGPSIKSFVESSGDSTCKDLFNSCVRDVADFRSGHVQTVTSYAVIPGSKAARESGDPEMIKETSAQNEELMGFLKGMRDSTGPVLE